MPFRTITEVAARVQLRLPDRSRRPAASPSYRGEDLLLGGLLDVLRDRLGEQEDAEPDEHDELERGQTAEAISVAVRQGVRTSGREWSTAA